MSKLDEELFMLMRKAVQRVKDAYWALVEAYEKAKEADDKQRRSARYLRDMQKQVLSDIETMAPEPWAAETDTCPVRGSRILGEHEIICYGCKLEGYRESDYA